MTKEKIQEIAFKMIGGIAKPKYDALEAVKRYKKDKNKKKLMEAIKQCNKELGEVGKMHLDIVKEEAEGKDLPYSMILLHAEDQYMTVQSMIEMISIFFE